jgi:Tat protein secretion system quality control protein TatD with DNase activity
MCFVFSGYGAIRVEQDTKVSVHCRNGESLVNQHIKEILLKRVFHSFRYSLAGISLVTSF